MKICKHFFKPFTAFQATLSMANSDKSFINNSRKKNRNLEMTTNRDMRCSVADSSELKEVKHSNLYWNRMKPLKSVFGSDVFCHLQPLKILNPNNNKKSLSIFHL